jgi:NDP-sugar pyrophosphorylase family protein
MTQIALLAGGLATRMRPQTETIPKSLLPVAGRPFIEWQLELLQAGGLRRVVLCVGYLGEQIVAAVGDGREWGMEVRYSWDPPGQPPGTGGALVNAFDLLEEAFFVLYGDSYLPTDYQAVAQAFEAASYPALMTVYRNENRWDPSNVRLEGDRVAYYEKGCQGADYIDYGLTALRREVLTEVSGAKCQVSGERSGPLDLAEIYRELVARGQMGAYEVGERFYEIGKPEGLQDLETYLRACG